MQHQGRKKAGTGNRCFLKVQVFTENLDEYRYRTGSLGQPRFELGTPSLSEKCSNQLSYWPGVIDSFFRTLPGGKEIS